MIKAGSHSRLDIFESCAFRAELAYIDKIPEPDRGTHSSGEWPNDRGTRIHKDAEAFIKKEGPLTVELGKFFKNDFVALQKLHTDGAVFGEEMWCFDEKWLPVPWDDDDPNKWDVFDEIRFRIKTDATVFLTTEDVIIIDYKSGKRYGNEVKHAEQMELYSMGAFLKYPDIVNVTAELWYLDQNELVDMKFTRAEAMQRLITWEKRNRAMLTCKTFDPDPSRYTCKWCPYGPAKSGHCQVGIQ